MRAFKTRLFEKWAEKQKVINHDLTNCLGEIANGKFDADLGGGLYKQRIALQGGGKSGGARVILALQIRSKAFFLYGFKKGDQGNLSTKEKKAYKIIAKTVLSYSDDELLAKILNGSLIEIVMPEEMNDA